MSARKSPHRPTPSRATVARRVVVTGLGVVSPIGIGIDTFWKSALAGRSGVTALSGFEELPLEGYRSQVAGQVLDWDVDRVPKTVQADRLGRYAQLALVAAAAAVEDAGPRSE